MRKVNKEVVSKKQVDTDKAIAVGNAIKITRLKAGLKRKDIYEKYHIPIRTLGTWERGERKCPDYVACLLIERISHDYKLNM